MNVEMTQSFGVDAQGRIASTTDPRAQLRAHVLTIIGTGLRERVMLPEYGVALVDYLFDSDEDSTAVLLASDIRTALERWEPGLIVNEVEPIFTSEADGLLTINVSYTSPNTGPELVSIPVNTAALYRGGLVEEQRSG